MQGGKTMGIFVLILQIILFSSSDFRGFSLLSRFVFNKVKINKWIILVAKNNNLPYSYVHPYESMDCVSNFCSSNYIILMVLRYS